MKQGKNSLNHDSNDLIDSADSKNQGNHDNHKNQGSDNMKGWEVKKLGEVCEISTGNANTEDAVENGEYAFFDRSKIIKKSSSYLYDCEAIIIAGEGQTFLPKFYYGKFNLHQRAYAIFNFNKSVSIDYAYKYLIHFHKYFEEVAVGATVKSLRLRHFQDLPIPLPPLQEQQRIVAILDEAFAAIAKAKANAQQNLQNAKELFESYLQGVFENKGEGWEEKTLGGICYLSAGGDVPKDNFSKTKTSKFQIPIYANGEKNDGLFGFTNIAKIIKPSITVSARGTIGFTVKRLESFFPIVRLVVVTPKNLNDLDLTYLEYSLKKIDFKHSGSSIPQLTVPMIKEYSFPFPPLKTQQTIVQKLDALNTETKKLESIYQQKINDLEELKKSVLQKAFSGELKMEKELV